MIISESKAFNCNDSYVNVFVDSQNATGIVELKVIRTDVDGDGTRVEVNFEVDTTEIDDLIKALQHAKAVANNN